VSYYKNIIIAEKSMIQARAMVRSQTFLTCILPNVAFKENRRTRDDHLTDNKHTAWAQFCCKMWGGQLDVKPI